MTEYIVTWTIDIDADSPRDAAEQALAIQRRPSGGATVFQVARVVERRGVCTSIVDEAEEIDLDLLAPEEDDELPCYCGQADCPRCGLA